MRSRLLQACSFVCAALLAGACTYLTPYKLEVQQGTVVSAENVGKLKVGMTRSQVSFVMGTPLLTDAFHADRWDYVYYLRKRDRVVDQRKVALFFDGDTLKDIRSDLPAAQEGAATAPAANPAATPSAAPAAPAAPAAAQPSVTPPSQQ